MGEWRVTLYYIIGYTGISEPTNLLVVMLYIVNLLYIINILFVTVVNGTKRPAQQMTSKSHTQTMECAILSTDQGLHSGKLHKQAGTFSMR